MITSPLRPRTQRQESGITAAGRLTHPRNALRRFTFIRHHDAPIASFRPALTEAPQRHTAHWDHPVNSGPRPCLINVGFPLSGLQDRTHTSDLNVRARHTPARLRLAGLRGRRQQPQPPPGLHSCASPTCPAFSVLALKVIDSSMVSVSPDVDREGATLQTVGWFGCGSPRGTESVPEQGFCGRL